VKSIPELHLALIAAFGDALQADVDLRAAEASGDTAAENAAFDRMLETQNAAFDLAMEHGWDWENDPKWNPVGELMTGADATAQGLAMALQRCRLKPSGRRNLAKKTAKKRAKK
jgi:hypothetical protein